MAEQARRKSSYAGTGTRPPCFALYDMPSNLACLHSMGGLLAADALIEFVRTRPDKNAPLWPRIVACIAYDTPVSFCRA